MRQLSGHSAFGLYPAKVYAVAPPGTDRDAGASTDAERELGLLAYGVMDPAGSRTRSSNSSR